MTLSTMPSAFFTGATFSTQAMCHSVASSSVPVSISALANLHSSKAGSRCYTKSAFCKRMF
jgi:hypothetical protein